MWKKRVISFILISLFVTWNIPVEAFPIGALVKNLTKALTKSASPVPGKVLTRVSRGAHESVENIDNISRLSSESSYMGKTMSKEVLEVPVETREHFKNIWQETYFQNEGRFTELFPSFKESLTFKESRNLDELVISLSEHEAVTMNKLTAKLFLMASALGISNEELDAARIRKESKKFKQSPDMYTHCLKLYHLWLIREDKANYEEITDIFPFCYPQKPSFSQLREINKKRILNQRTQIKK